MCENSNRTNKTISYSIFSYDDLSFLSLMLIVWLRSFWFFIWNASDFNCFSKFNSSYFYFRLLHYICVVRYNADWYNYIPFWSDSFFTRQICYGGRLRTLKNFTCQLSGKANLQSYLNIFFLLIKYIYITSPIIWTSIVSSIHLMNTFNMFNVFHNFRGI